MSVKYGGEFTTIFWAGTEITAYFPPGDISPQLGVQPLDQTALRSGGNPTVVDNRRGILTSEFTLKTYYDPTLCKLMRQYVKSRTGALLQIMSGLNALPTIGDELFSGYYSIFSYSWPYMVNQVSQIDWELKIPDGATVVPSIGVN